MHASPSLRDTRITLNHGDGQMPAVGFGTLIADGGRARQAFKLALEAGYRHFDCAERYRNEAIVGCAFAEAMASGVVRRKDLFVTTKLWNTNHRPERVEPALDASLERLGIAYVDAYLIHTPFAFQPGDEQDPRDEHGQPVYDTGVTLLDTWHAMEQLVDKGKCRAIGLSDITLDKLKEIVAGARIKPSVVQIECHPYLPEWEMLEFCQLHGIVLLAFAPLGHGMEPRITEDATICRIAEHTGMTPAQVALSWAAQRGTAFLTTSTSSAHIAENIGIAPLPDDAMHDMRDGITMRVRMNNVVNTGVPGFIPRKTA
ncbi:aldo/keto reductase [Rothia nasimurium]|uniref:Aldo/keto reductase n=1 Tax=Luteibacter anthropi TaxID=564369 RepID=A0A7X5UCH6_9GAMM|nr:aldo/keto reductase [Luteibacter anthropi]NII07965.1 aldo/keto reductase [Luteibacter anthropi]